jgi:hypothetical protein
MRWAWAAAFRSWAPVFTPVLMGWPALLLFAFVKIRLLFIAKISVPVSSAIIALGFGLALPSYFCT